jgi:hypothetical protein
MSSALKRRFNFETVAPIKDLKMEVELVRRECERLLNESAAPVETKPDAIELLVTAFHDLREGVTADGIQVEKPSAVMSTAEAVSVAFSAGLDSFYYGQRQLTAGIIARHLATAALKDNVDDVKKLRHYFDTVVQKRSKEKGGSWDEFWKARSSIA